MAQTPVTTDLHEALDVLRPLTAEIAFDLEVLVDVGAKLRGSPPSVEVANLGVRVGASRAPCRRWRAALERPIP